MNNPLTRRIGGEAAIRVAILMLGIALATASQTLAFGGGRFGGGGGGRSFGGRGWRPQLGSGGRQ